MSYNIKSGDLFTLYETLKWDDGSAIDLSDADAVYLIARLDGATEAAIIGECEIVDRVAGQVSYSFNDGETDVPGMYRYEYEIRFPAIGTEDFRPFTVPSKGRLWLHIESDLA